MDAGEMLSISLTLAIRPWNVHGPFLRYGALCQELSLLLYLSFCETWKLVVKMYGYVKAEVVRNGQD